MNPYNMQINQSPGAGSSSDGFGKYSNPTMMQQSQMKSTSNSIGGFNVTSSSGVGFKKQAFVSKPIDPMVLEEFKQLISDLNTNDWNKRLKLTDDLTLFVTSNSNVIKQAQPSKFIQLIDAYCKLIQDNNAKVQAHAQKQFQKILMNPCTKSLTEQNISLIIQALNNNLNSNNMNVREQGDQLFTILEGIVDANTIVQPVFA
mmetsp:Transcript_19177/g.18317  ORF Transcript_19177/g.18317 Transcript_19177/m.18317 type:complete len:202 (+) Transcript_19177:2447-3052(+)|eukprot:CAMPEP_0170565484 /NCGR_PEP_ID=MMETSP0211-20121228/79209_1 /TAXON_ID=311385 /ORGANISM="Pseudokeronopsis sp., Strain OXSARD2" /LENGTH=201 /DNA_ID=CAMNT_0010886369 /DNA_START=4003 /DNA_END=4608 /DNA_ORIENTATION=+